MCYGKESTINNRTNSGTIAEAVQFAKKFKATKENNCIDANKKQIDNTREDLSNYLGVHKRTLERWINAYLQGGIEQLLLIKPKRKDSKIITKDIHDGLAQG